MGKNGKYKIVLMAAFLAGSCFLTYYCHAIIKIDHVFTHLFYIPIILAALWWKRKGLFVAVLLAGILIFSHIFIRPTVTSTNDYLRAFMFVVIAAVLAELSRNLAKAKEQHKRYTQQLQERTKELNCLYGLSKLVEQENITIDGIFQGITELSKEACQYPDITCARVVFGDREFKTENFKATQWKLSANIKVVDQKAGMIEVYYLEEKPVIDEGPFLSQERNLIEAVAERLGRITERKQVEDEMRKFKTIADKANYGAAIVTLDGVFLYVNEYFAIVHGYTPKQLIGKNLTIFHNEDQIKDVLETNQRLKEIGNINAVETWHTHKNGTVFPMMMNILIIKGESNQPLYLAATAINITKNNQLEAEVEIYKERISKAQKHTYVNAMSAIVAHQLNQPLTTINMLLDKVLEMESDKDQCCPSVLEKIERCLKESQRAASIIRDFRQYSKTPAFEATGTVSLSNTANRVITLISQRAKRAKMNISVKALDNLPELEFNETALEQIFLIIIQNAIEAADGKKQHKLDIVGNFTDDTVELQFSDDCCGIAPENLDKIFEPFFSTKSEDKGMGLGLDIVQQILISCGGEVRVESELGKGTSFYITLPVGQIRKP